MIPGHNIVWDIVNGVLQAFNASGNGNAPLPISVNSPQPPQSFFWNGTNTTINVTGPSGSNPWAQGNSTVTVTALTGVTNALVRVEASLDGVNFTGIATLQLSAPGTAQCPIALPYPFLRANVIQIAGGSVSATVQAGNTPLTLAQGSSVAVNPTLSGIPALGWTTLCSLGIPIIMPSSGTITAGGALTLNVALTNKYNCWMYFPSGAFSTLPAGLYYVSMSSTTAGTVYTNTLPLGSIPYVPGTGTNPALGTAAVGSGSAYTGVISLTTLLSIPVPGNAMGLNGALKLRYNVRCVNDANTKYMLLYACTTPTQGSSGTGVCNSQAANQASWGAERTFRNAGAANVQTLFDSSNISTLTDFQLDGAALSDASIDTTQTFWITFCGSPGAVTDWVMLNFFDFQLLPQS